MSVLCEIGELEVEVEYDWHRGCRATRTDPGEGSFAEITSVMLLPQIEDVARVEGRLLEILPWLPKDVLESLEDQCAEQHAELDERAYEDAMERKAEAQRDRALYQDDL